LKNSASVTDSSIKNQLLSVFYIAVNKHSHLQHIQCFVVV